MGNDTHKGYAMKRPTRIVDLEKVTCIIEEDRRSMSIMIDGVKVKVPGKFSSGKSVVQDTKGKYRSVRK